MRFFTQLLLTIIAVSHVCEFPLYLPSFAAPACDSTWYSRSFWNSSECSPNRLTGGGERPWRAIDDGVRTDLHTWYADLFVAGLWFLCACFATANAQRAGWLAPFLAGVWRLCCDPRAFWHACGTTWRSAILHRLARRETGIGNPATIRSLFNATPLVTPNRPWATHTHANSAVVRNSASAFADEFARLLGTRAYFMQRSAADERKGRAGSRDYYWSRDLSTAAEGFDPGERDLLVIIDTDMYIDVPAMLASDPRTYLISTFQPTCLARCDGKDYSFTFDENNEVLYRVGGGAEYRHQVWNYKNDILVAESFGFFWDRRITYNVERKALDGDHQLVCLIPQSDVCTPACLREALALGGAHLQRFAPAVRVGPEVYLRLDVMTKEGLKRHTGTPLRYHAVQTTAAQDDALAALARLSSISLQAAQVQSIIPNVHKDDAILLALFHRAKAGPPSEVVFPISESVNRVQFEPESYDAGAAPLLVPYMNPFLPECYAPDRTIANEAQGVRGRVLEVRNAAKPLTETMLSYMDEYVSKIVPPAYAGKGHPVDLDEVYKRQSRPTQRKILSEAALLACEPERIATANSFMKAEAYGKITDPRLITNIRGIPKLRYSTYMYAFTDMFHGDHNQWNTVGRTPAEIAARVVEICEGASRVTLTDFSRQDGRVNANARALERKAMLRFFDAQYHAEMLEMMATQKDRHVYTTCGVEYESGDARLSDRKSVV